MEKNEYNNYYIELHNKRISHLITFLIKHVKSGSKIGIIGYSMFDAMIRDKLSDCTIYNIFPSVDFARQEVDLAANILVYDITERKSVEKAYEYDCIIFTEVLEHLFSDDFLVINNVARLLRKSGFLFFSVPNVSALGKLIPIIVGENPYMKKSEIVEGAFGGFGHIREYSFREVRNLLMNDFRIIKLEGWNDYPNIFDKVAKLLPKIYAETIFAFCQKL